MKIYEITFSHSAIKEIESLNNNLLKRIWQRIEDMAQEPRPPGCLKLKGSTKLWRIRVGQYRVLYSIYDNKQVVDIIAIKHRKDAYK